MQLLLLSVLACTLPPQAPMPPQAPPLPEMPRAPLACRLPARAARGTCGPSCDCGCAARGTCDCVRRAHFHQEQALVARAEYDDYVARGFSPSYVSARLAWGRYQTALLNVARLGPRRERPVAAATMPRHAPARTWSYRPAPATAWPSPFGACRA